MKLQKNYPRWKERGRSKTQIATPNKQQVFFVVVVFVIVVVIVVVIVIVIVVVIVATTTVAIDIAVAIAVAVAVAIAVAVAAAVAIASAIDISITFALAVAIAIAVVTIVVCKGSCLGCLYYINNTQHMCTTPQHDCDTSLLHEQGHTAKVLEENIKLKQ